MPADSAVNSQTKAAAESLPRRLLASACAQVARSAVARKPTRERGDMISMRALAAHAALKRREARERSEFFELPLASLATTYSPAS